MTVRSLTSKRLEFASADEAIESYLERGWTDGLPVVPPTPVRVGDFLEYSGRPPSEIIGAEPTKGRVITAEKVAINAVMAGCLPEYGPVVLAAVEALCKPSFNLHAITVSTAGAAVLVAVNGPAASETGLNSGVSLFGPGHRANATIGRAVRLAIGNVTGAAPGVLDKATLGHCRQVHLVHRGGGGDQPLGASARGTGSPRRSGRGDRVRRSVPYSGEQRRVGPA